MTLIDARLRARLAEVVPAREHEPRAPDGRRSGEPWSVTEERIALDDLGLEIVGRGAPDPLTLGHLGLKGPPPPTWEEVLFLDTETTGLAGGAGTYVFLLGTARIADGELILRQHLLRDLGAERAFVGALAAELEQYRTCASYNGKCFDLPLLRARVVLALRAELSVDEAHLDLLHPARRLWRGRFGSTGLRQLEDSVLEEPREDDIPGALIPERFFRWLRAGDDALIAPVLTHNARDLVSLVRITDRIARAVIDARAGRTPDHPPAALGLARVFERQGEHAAAFFCLESAYADGDAETRIRAALPYARALERRGDRTGAATLLGTLLELGQGTRAWRAQAEGRVRRLSRAVRPVPAGRGSR